MKEQPCVLSRRCLTDGSLSFERLSQWSTFPKQKQQQATMKAHWPEHSKQEGERNPSFLAEIDYDSRTLPQHISKTITGASIHSSQRVLWHHQAAWQLQTLSDAASIHLRISVKHGCSLALSAMTTHMYKVVENQSGRHLYIA